MGPIPTSRIRNYALDLGLDSDIVEQFVRILRLLDGRYIDWVKSESAKSRRASKGPGK